MAKQSKQAEQELFVKVVRQSVDNVAQVLTLAQKNGADDVRIALARAALFEAELWVLKAVRTLPMR